MRHKWSVPLENNTDLKSVKRWGRNTHAILYSTLSFPADKEVENEKQPNFQPPTAFDSVVWNSLSLIVITGNFRKINPSPGHRLL